MKKIFTLFYHVTQKLFLPYRCILCFETGDQKRDLCLSCQTTLPILLHSCQQCGSALPQTVKKCGQCLQHAPYFDHTQVGFHYVTPIANWLKQFKFHKKTLYARILCEVFAEKLQKKMHHTPNIKPDFLLPVPLHWKRLIKRGFNQAHIIAKYLSRECHIPIIHNSTIKRIKTTTSQSSLKKNKRRYNIQNAFSLEYIGKIEHIAIVDDVMTTGNTVNELAKILKKHGIKYVSIWALARAT